MSLDEQTHGEAIDWGEVRSACAARDWRRAWETVGVDHEGAATPGEVYLFGVAKGVRAVSAALFHWRSERRSEIDKRMMARIRHKQAKAQGPHGVAPLPEYEASWTRIKAIAAWESSAKAQHVSKVKPTMGVDMASGRDFSAVVNAIDLTYFGESSRFTREAFDRLAETLRSSELRIPSSVQHDARTVLDDLIAMRAMDRPVLALPSDMQMRWVEHEGSPLEGLRRSMAQREATRGTLIMSQDTAHALRQIPELRDLPYVIDEMAGRQIFVAPNGLNPLTPNPRGPAQRKRRGR